MAKFKQGYYQVLNESKYIGKGQPIYRSGWELQVMRMCDSHPSITAWASEPIRIPYQNPITGKATTYVPDFLMVYLDANGTQHAEIIEVKPAKEQPWMTGGGKKAQLARIMNEAKWKAASQWCKQQGINFRIITENEIFNSPNRKKK